MIAPGAGSPVRPAPSDNVARGFVLYMGIDEETAAAAGTSIAKLAQEIRAYAQSLVAGAESYAAVAVAPASAPGSALDVVRSTFGDPTAGARQRTETARLQQPQDPRPSGVLIDLARREVHLDGESLNLTFKEFELLNYLVENGTRTVGRDELLEGLWRNAEEVRMSGPLTSTSAACVPSSAASPTPCAPCAARATGSTSTPRWLSGPLRNTRSSLSFTQSARPLHRERALSRFRKLQRLSAGSHIPRRAPWVGWLTGLCRRCWWFLGGLCCLSGVRRSLGPLSRLLGGRHVSCTDYYPERELQDLV
ncbi:hypothetical protein NicSoilC12_13770 [Arthrobacter sp. NicSoilC12]|nr:hypothetical protein NicSoilC12_13770 [Arthrobacter sp. NicSoilC12]